MAEPEMISLSIAEGWWPSAASTGPGRRPNSCRDGRNMLWLGPGLIRSAKGLGVAPPLSGVGAARLYILMDRIASVDGTGSIIPFRGSTELFITKEGGAGIISGSVIHDGTSGRLRYYANGARFNAGLVAPVLAVPSLSEGADSFINFTSAAVAICLTRIRTTKFLEGGSDQSTLAESNGSEPSNIIAVTNKKVRLKFPAAGIGLDMHDAWGIYTTFLNNGSLGPFLFLRTIMEQDISPDRMMDLEWMDSEISPVDPLPTSNNPPPLGEFVCNIGNVTIVLNTRAGMGDFGAYYAASKPGFFEHYSAFGEGQFSPPTKIKGFTARPSDGELVAWGEDAILAAQLTGNPTAPVLFRAILPDKGVASPMGACFADNELYCYNKANGPFMLDGIGNPDESFAVPVRDFIRDMDPPIDPSKVAVGHDPMSDGIVYCLGGDLALIYHRSLSRIMGMPIWSVPYELNGNLGAAVTSAILFKSQLVIGRDSGMFGFENGIAQPAWYVISAKQDRPASMGRKTILGKRLHVKASGMIAKTYLNDADPNGAADADLTLTDTKTGDHYTNWLRFNRHCENWTLRVEGTNSDERIDDIAYMAMYEPGLMINQPAA